MSISGFHRLNMLLMMCRRKTKIHDTNGFMNIVQLSDFRMEMIRKNHVMITGDSDKTAWKEHITDYHKDNLPAKVLVHHIMVREHFQDR